MRIPLIDLASVDRQTSSVTLTFKSTQPFVLKVPEVILVGIALVIMRAYQSASAYRVKYGEYLFEIDAIDYDQYLSLKHVWQWLTNDRYTPFSKVHSMNYTAMEHFMRRRDERKPATFGGYQVLLVHPALHTPVMEGTLLVRQTRYCDDLIETIDNVMHHVNFVRKEA